ncbi:MAG: hypothetical protein K6C94_08665 [Candidatus Gastranaerophilales bacterium]|nr:hypothetical protein [Candidatus Gastranaerophilales bacterium]
MNEHTNTHYKYTGVMHIHSVHSDGSGDVWQISKAAKDTGLDWVLISDHDNFDIEEGIFNGVTVLKGEELSPEVSDHYLALDIDKYLDFQDSPQKNVDLVHEIGGFGFAVHPDESENRKNKYPPIKWTDKNVIPDGIEIWNWFSQWGDNFDTTNVFTTVYAHLFRHRLVKKPYRQTLEWWDELNKNSDKIIPAIAGTDAHALKVRYVLPLVIFPYKSMFKTLLNEICLREPLAEDFETRKRQILNAVKTGKNIIFNRRIGQNPPEFFISDGNTTAFSGENIYLNEKTYLCLNCYKKSDIKVYKDGKEYISLKSQESRIKITETGKYRFEAEINGFGYAYSNPVTVR